jgi:type II secretory pathway component PulK
MFWLNLDIRRAEHLQAGTERLAFIETNEAIAAEKIQAVSMDWDRPWFITLNGMQMRGQLQDLSGRFNVNTLFLPEVPEDQPPALQPKAVLSRILSNYSVSDPDSVVEDLESSHRILLGLGQVPALEPAKKSCYAAEPTISQVNINATTPLMLSSLLDIPLPLAGSILAEKPFENSEAIRKILNQFDLKYEPMSSIDLWLGTESRYYVLETTIQQKRLVRIYSVFEKDEKSIKLLWRSWGTLP